MFRLRTYHPSWDPWNILTIHVTFHSTPGVLESYFGKYGEMIEVAIIRDKTGATRGFGFVTFKDEASMSGALEDGDEHLVNGFPVEVKRSTHGESASSSSRKVFVGGMGPTVSKDTLKEYFSAFGTVSDAQVMYDYTSGRSRGFGFVTFEDEAAAKLCMDGKVHVIAGQMVDVKAAMPRPGERNGSGPGHGHSGGMHGMRRFSHGFGGYRGTVGGPGGPGGAGNFFPYPYMADFSHYPLVNQYHPALAYTAQVIGIPPAYGSQMTYAAYGSPAFMMGPMEQRDEYSSHSSIRSHNTSTANSNRGSQTGPDCNNGAA
jgi:hypothetical protein